MMNNRFCSSCILAVAILGGAGILGVSSLPGQQSNIVFIVVDDAGYADFGFMGSTEIPTPNLDALASNGLRFTQAYTGQACSPSRAAFLTGRHHNHWGYEANLLNNNNPLTQHFEGLPNAATTMFERLKGLGYSTSVAGKWHVGGMDDVVSNGQVTLPGNKPPRQGVDHFIGFQAGGGLQEMYLNPDGTSNVSSYDAGGKYWSDLWGDTTVNYIDQHYQDPNPFFIYTSFNDPHSPINEAPSFNDPRLDGLTGQRRRYASEILTIDNNVGKIIDKLNDPNGDGNTADSIMDDTMIVFLNDNGGVPANSADNGFLRGAKGTPYDGGIRVPMFISGANIDPAVRGLDYDDMVHSVDIVPTMVAAAGGSVPADELDGVNLLPFINGANTESPHEFMAQRLQEEVFYRTNDWKLVKDGYASDWELYDFSDPTSYRENAGDDLASTNPQQVATMQKLLTDWEVTIDKQRFPSTDESISDFNLFDDFSFHPQTSNFSASNGWLDPQGNPVTMRDRDSHNGTVFQFDASDTSYTAINDLRRMNQLEFIAHGFSFEGQFSGQDDRSGTISGLPVILAKNLDGQLPQLRLNAGSQGAANARFKFELALNTQLYDDLEITGDGSQRFVVSGDITEYREGRHIIKSGSSSIRFQGQVQATGTGYVAQQGTSVFEDSSTLGGNLHVASGAKAVADGRITGSVANSGTFVVGENSGGTVSQTVSLSPARGDGDVDSRNVSTEGDQDTQILVGSVSNANASQVERVQRALLSFDLADIPDTAEITSASVTLQFDGNDSSSSNNISGDLELYELAEDPVFSETGSENVNWNFRDLANGSSWTAAGGTLNDLVAIVPNGNLPNPITTVQGDSLSLQSLNQLTLAIEQNLGDNVISFALLLPGEEADAAAMIGDRDLYRFGSNESTGSSPAALLITYESRIDRIAHIDGDFAQDVTGSVEFDLRSPEDFDQLVVGQTASLDGDLIVNVETGSYINSEDEFEILISAELVGSFDNASSGERLDIVGGAGSFLVTYDETTDLVRLSDFLVNLPGDYNNDGTVDAADFTVWRDNLGAPEGTLLNDPEGGTIGLLQYNTWVQNFGSFDPDFVAVPEPTSLQLLLVLLVSQIAGRRRSLRQTSPEIAHANLRTGCSDP